MRQGDGHLSALPTDQHEHVADAGIFGVLSVTAHTVAASTRSMESVLRRCWSCFT